MKALITWDNYQEKLSHKYQKYQSLFRQYANTPTYTGVNGEIFFNFEKEIFEPISDAYAEAHNIKLNIAETWDIN